MSSEAGSRNFVLLKWEPPWIGRGRQPSRCAPRFLRTARDPSATFAGLVRSESTVEVFSWGELSFPPNIRSQASHRNGRIPNERIQIEASARSVCHSRGQKSQGRRESLSRQTGRSGKPAATLHLRGFVRLRRHRSPGGVSFSFSLAKFDAALEVGAVLDADACCRDVARQ